MVKADLYSAKGIRRNSISLPKEFGEEISYKLLAQAARVYEDSTHPGLAKVKTRAEVNRTKKKVYRQKGTGGARHGSRSAPIYVGGGVAHGPKGVKRVLELPTKMGRKALHSILSLLASRGRIYVVEGLDTFQKTKDAAYLLDKIGVSKGVVALSDKNLKTGRILRNVKGIKVLPYKDLNPYDLFLFENLVIDSSIFEKEKAKRKVVRKETK